MTIQGSHGLIDWAGFNVSTNTSHRLPMWQWRLHNW